MFILMPLGTVRVLLLPPDDGDAWIRRLEEAQADCRPDFIEENIPRIERLIARLQERAYEIAQAQYRLRLIRDRHEPPARKRLRQGG